MHCFKCGLEVRKETSWYGIHTTCFQDWFQLQNLEKFENIASRQKSDEPMYKMRGVNSSFFHGKFRKYSSTLGGRKYILKVEEKEYPELPATEYLCNQIFTHLKINVPPFYLIFFEDQHPCFVTENFMDHFPAANLVHIYRFMESHMEHDCENLLRIIGDKTGRISAREDFVFLTLADSLIGNNDRHGRNLGLIQSTKGFVLAPFYDNPSYLGTELSSLLDADHQPRGAIWTKTAQAPTMKDYIKEWERLGFGYVIERFRKILSVETVLTLIRSSYLTPKRQQALIRLVSKRSEELWA